MIELIKTYPGYSLIAFIAILLTIENCFKSIGDGLRGRGKSHEDEE